MDIGCMIGSKKVGYVCVPGILVGLVLVSFFSLSSSSTSADDVWIDDTTISVPVSCSLSGTGMNTHNATIPNGTYTNNIGTTTLKAFCNDTNGFAIYAAGYTGNTIGEENSNKLVGTPAGIGNIVTGIATTAGNPDISNWAMKLTATGDSGDTSGTNALTIDSAPNVSGGADASFSNYHTVPNEFTKVAHKNSATDMTENTGGVTLTTTYAAYIAQTQPAGTYQGQVIYTLVHPANADAPLVVCNPDATTISEVKCMQDFGSMNSTTRTAILGSMTTGTQYTLKDSRDGKSYTIAKLADGNVWMTQNLDLDLDATKTYTNEDTDIGYNTTTGEYDTAAWSPERSTYTTGTTTWGLYDETEDYYGGYDHPESYDPGNLYWNGAESDYNDWQAYYDSCDWSTSTPVCNESLNPISTYTSSTGTAEYHLGNYYNWTAAVAMNDSSSHTTNNELIEQSICPAGWTLPRRGVGEDSFYALWNQYGFADSSINGANKLWTSPLYFAASGEWAGTLGGVGVGGAFWSPVVYDRYAAGYAYFGVDGGSVPSDYSGRINGYSVRCVARPVSSSISEGGGGGGGCPECPNV